MKRIITTLIAALMVFGLLLPYVPKVSAQPETENQHATMIINRWHRVGENEYGDPLDGQRSFPWQNPGEPLSQYWGRSGYDMPNANVAVSTNGIARAARQITGNAVDPMLWTTVYLTIKAQDGESRPISNEVGDIKAIGRWYVVMDSAGQVWFDMDGHFHDSRYLATADPFSPYYAYETTSDPNTQQVLTAQGSAISNPRAKVDPSESNNTQGPYHFTPTLPNGKPNPYYVEPCFFWVRPELTKIVSSVTGKNICDAYANHTLKGESRAWQLGIVSKPDYMAIGRSSPLGLYVSDGVVRAGEWDIGLSMLPFQPNEVWAENPYNTPFNGQFDPDDDVYRDIDGNMVVSPGDVRLTNVTLNPPPNTVTYLQGTTVAAGDTDIGRALNQFPANFKYASKGVSVRTQLDGAANPAFGGGMYGNVISVKDITGITVGSTVRIGPNSNGQYDIRRVVNIVTQTTASWRYNRQYSWWPPQYVFYTYPYDGNSGTFGDGDYAYIGAGANEELVRISGTPWSLYWWWPYYQVTRFTTNWIYYHQTYYERMIKPKYILILDSPVTNTHAKNEIVELVGFKPGDFIYQLAGGNHDNVRENDVRYTDVDLHRVNNQIIGQGAWIDDALVMIEVLYGDPNDPRYQGSVKNSDWGKDGGAGNRTMGTKETAYGQCMPVFDISVESDFWQGERVWTIDPTSQQWVTEWKGVAPSVTAAALRSPNPDMRPASNRVAKATVLGPEGKDFFVHATTFHNVSLDYREWLGLEVFCDNGYDNIVTPNPFGMAATPLDLNDNYIRGTLCEAYLGCTDRGVDLDYGRPLEPLLGATDSPMFYDLNNDGLYGCNEPIYFDLDRNGAVSAKDRRAFPINMQSGGLPLSNGGNLAYYPAGSIVAQGDIDVNRALTQFPPTIKFYDSLHPVSRLPSGIYEYGEDIYYDIPEMPSSPNGNNYVNAGDIRKSKVTIGSTSYRCGETVGIGDTFYNQYPAYMVTLGRNGDYNYLDVPVLAFPTMDVTVTVDKQLKVEQTSHISIEVNPPPKPGESIFVSLRETLIEAKQPVPAQSFYDVRRNVGDNWLNHSCQGQMTNTACQQNNNFVTLPWPFKFYGQTYNQINVGLSGFVILGNNNYWEAIYLDYCWYTTDYGQYPAFLEWVGYPARIHVASMMWRANSVCWNNNVTWPATGERVVVVTWKGSYGPTFWWPGNYPVPNDNECQLVLFENGSILMQYKRLTCPPWWWIRSDYDIGITDGNGQYEPYMPDAGACNFGSDGNVMFVPITIPEKPGVPQLRIAEDLKWITKDNPTANIEFTPYRGTCLEDGTRSPVEINLYRDVGGIDDPVPRNPPPLTYLSYKEPSYSTTDPWNGIVIATDSVFGYQPGDTVLIGHKHNTEKRTITEVHVGTSGANANIQYLVYNSTSTLPSTCIPVSNTEGFVAGNPVIVGRNTDGNQESHIIKAVYQAPNPPFSTNLTQNASSGKNVSFNVNDASGFQIGDYIGFGLYDSSWWTNDITQGRDTARISAISGNTITVEVLHSSFPAWSTYIVQMSAVEVRDPLKFGHTVRPGNPNPPPPDTYQDPEPIFTTKFAMTLDRGLNYNHIFGEPVIGVLYFDPYWVENKWSRFDSDMYPTREFSGLLSADPVSADLGNSYDCYWRGRFNIEPEEIDIKPELKKCLTTLDQRYPNVLVSLWDHDNPNDVNDPANIPISCSADSGQTIIANVNATGAGVAYLCTVNGFDLNAGPNADVDPSFNAIPGNPTSHRYILQVNTDGTYDWWRWFEPASGTNIYGALDPEDWLYRWLDDDPDNGPLTGPPYNDDRTPMPQHDNQYETRLIDNDASFGGGVCDPCNKDSYWPCLGDITARDAYGRFMGVIGDGYSDHPSNGGANPRGNPNYQNPVYGRIGHFGIPVVIDRWTLGNDGGQIMFPVRPTQGGILHVRIYTYQAIFDYNSANNMPPHTPGPYFVEDSSNGIDYCGYIDYDVQNPDPDVNFIEMRTIDHALQNSMLNYTTGVSPIYPLDPPAPRIQHDYYPILNDMKRQFRSYPGGQTHTGRLVGNTKGFGWNAYPAIWRNQFVKLGTEFYPLTDYGLYFILADASGNHLGFSKDPGTEPNLAVKTITITGPFMTPYYFNPSTLNCILGTLNNPYYQYNNVRGVPIAYDYSGKIVVDSSNANVYFDYGGNDYSTIANPLSIDGVNYDTANSWLIKWKDLSYFNGFWTTNTTHKVVTPNPVTAQPTGVNIFDEIIPISSGKLSIEVELHNGVKKIYEDCCEAKISGTMREIPIHGLKIDGLPLNVTVDSDNVFDVKLTEDTGKGMLENGEWLNVECNDAILFAWQDKGVIDPETRLIKGAFDGWITLPPHSSAVSKVETAFKPAEDVNGDGKISYLDDETEILGSYNMATNTWQGGFIDARTFQRDNGMYKLELKKEYGASVKTVGVDIGGVDKNGKPLPRDVVDHIIDDTEVTPVVITAYKYGDDNQDRAFSPLYDQVTFKDYSHEVYLAGQAAITVEPIRDLQVTYGPEPLTAGVVSENVGQPLTFTITDYNNDPVDLSKGIADSAGEKTVIDESIWRNLFKDPHPDNWTYYGKTARLPQYYWLRTDLHNVEDKVGEAISNTDLYEQSFNPIAPDFTEKAKGIYRFKGFIANDKGQFEVYFYTPDRKHGAVTTVKVVNPKVKYEIINMEDVNNIYTVPGDPDFVMTGGDNRVYMITVTCSNAQDALLKGVAKTVSVCSGEGKDIARFTPAITVPTLWYFLPTSSQTLYLGVDINGDKKLTTINSTQSEYNRFFTPIVVNGISVFYNTFNMRYSDYSYEAVVNGGPNSWYPSSVTSLFPRPNTRGGTQFRSVPRSFGIASIYNDVYDGTYLMADLTTDGRLTYRDSLSLDDNARTTFYLYATDSCYLTGLVGMNEYCNSPQYGDVAINPGKFSGRPFDPNYVKTRFSSSKNNRTPSADYYLFRTGARFALDWEAFADHKATVAPPRIMVIDPVSGEEWGKALGEQNNYDLTYSVQNHMLVRAYPADNRDKPIHEGNTIEYSSSEKGTNMLAGQHERMVLGRLQKNPDDPNTMECNIFVTPTGTGLQYAGLLMRSLYTNSLYSMEFPWWQIQAAISVFDVTKGLEIIPQVADKLKVGRNSKITIKVVVAGGSGEPLQGIDVTLGGVVDTVKGVTNQKGEVELSVTPKEAGRIRITAKSEKYGNASAVVGVENEVAPPTLIVEPIPSITNKTEIVVKGKTNPGNTIKIGGQTVKTNADGTFSYNYKLNNEGINQFDVDATNQAGVLTTQMFAITRDTVKPTIIVDQTDPTGRVFASPNLIISGRVEPFSKVKVNGVDAIVVYDIWTVALNNVNPGQLNLTIEAVDIAGNNNSETKTVDVWMKDVILLQDNDPNMLLNGSPLSPLPRSPYLSKNIFMVPVETFTAFFKENAPVPANDLLNVTLAGKTYQLNIAATNKGEITVDGSTLTLANKFETTNGVTFVDAEAFAKLLGLGYDFNAATKVLTMTRIWK